MRYMHIVHANNLESARRSYLEMLERRGVVLAATAEIFVETVHRAEKTKDTWLCYIAMPRNRAA